jgi:ATP/maltotriose-dependent transcriptional regulator MalT
MPSLIGGSPPARPLGSGQWAPLRALVPRVSLFERLSAAAGAVILVCAPAGSGKTVLLG